MEYHSRTSRLLQHQRQVYIEVATEDWLRQVAARIHVVADRIRAGGVGSGRCPPPVAGGDLLRGLVVVEGQSSVANDATARHAGRPGDVPVVVHATTSVGGRVIQDAAARHRRRADRVVDATAGVGGRVARAGSADGAAILDVQHGPVVDAAASPGRVGADGAAIHRRGADKVKNAAAIVVGRVARAGPADGAAVLHVQRGLVVDAAAVAGGRVGADGAAIPDRRPLPGGDPAAVVGRVGADGAASHRRRAGIVVADAAAVFGSVGADGAAIHRRGAVLVVDAAAVPGCRVGADGTAIHHRGAAPVVDAAAVVGRVTRLVPSDGAVVLDVKRGFVVDPAAGIVGLVGADGAAIHRRGADRVVDTSAVFGRVGHADPADGAAVLDVQRGIVVESAAAVGRVGADGTARHRRRAVVSVEDAAADAGSLVARAGPPDGAAVHDVQCGLVVDAAAVPGYRVGADDAAIHSRGAGLVLDSATVAGDGAIAYGHTGKGDRVGAAAAGTDVKHPVYPTPVNVGFRCAVTLDGQVAAIQDVQVAADIGVIARCPSQDDRFPVGRRGVKGDGVGARVAIGVVDGPAQGTDPTGSGSCYDVGGGPGWLCV